MPRAVIAVVVAVVIAALTAIAIVVTSASFDERTKKDASAQLSRAFPVVQKLAQLEGIDIYGKVDRLAGDVDVIAALQTKDQVEIKNHSDLAFQRYVVADAKQGIKPDLLVLVDKDGNVIAQPGATNIVAKLWRNEAGDITVAPLKLVLSYGKRMIVSDIWDDGDRGMMKVGVAPIADPAAPDTIIGAAFVAYAQTAREAQHTETLLGTEIAYYVNGRVIATSFTRGKSKTEEDTSISRSLTELLKAGKISDADEATARPTRVTVDGVEYYAAAVQMPRSFSKPPPTNYPAMTAGAMLLAPIADASGTSGTVTVMLALVGGGAIVIAILGLFLLYRRLISQVDQLEIGIADIINGNVDRTFRPVGAELDGLANGLNVMLARLFGRAEPGEEELDDEGNPVPSSAMEFEEGGEEAGDAARASADPELAALAQESEPDYYKRVWTEYVAARAAAGTPDEVTFENFIAKLKVNEGKLKAQYECRAVRFRVVTKDGKVSLKPVPIFA